MEHYAKIIEDNGGGLSLYIMDAEERCVFAHSGYEYCPGTLSADIKALIEDDSVSDWEGNEEGLIAEWPSLDLDEIGRELIAEVADGKLSLYSKRMGYAGCLEFDVEDEED